MSHNFVGPVSLVALSLVRWGTEECKRRYLPELCAGRMLGCFGLTEPNAGSDPAGKCGDLWALNGTKPWIWNATVADLALAFAQTDPAKGPDGIVAFLVEKGSRRFSTGPITEKLDLRESDTGELIFEDCAVPDSALLGPRG